MKKVHLKVTVIPNHPTAAPYEITGCNQLLGEHHRKLEAVPDFRAVTCIRCQLSDAFYNQKENLIKGESV